MIITFIITRTVTITIAFSIVVFVFAATAFVPCFVRLPRPWKLVELRWRSGTNRPIVVQQGFRVQGGGFVGFGGLGKHIEAVHEKVEWAEGAAGFEKACP